MAGSTLHGVNLSGWLVPEPWVTPELFSGTRATSDDALFAAGGPKHYEELVRGHRATFVNAEDFQRMAGVINQPLAGHTLSTIDQPALAKIRDEIQDEPLYESALEVIHRALDSGKRERLYLGGTTQMLEQPEFHDVEKVKETLLILEKEELMKDVLHAHMGDGLEVTIGQENEDRHFQDSSIITATYHLDGELLGTIAVLGPTRMEYAKAMSLLAYMNSNLKEVIKRFHW